jgi:hypothetical protein
MVAPHTMFGNVGSGEQGMFQEKAVRFKFKSHEKCDPHYQAYFPSQLL